ncbi:hypothetical protein MMC29_000507 [Sticta canariensis]|nr:hypothetical protein [Sticta canariensis]
MQLSAAAAAITQHHSPQDGAPPTSAAEQSPPTVYKPRISHLWTLAFCCRSAHTALDAPAKEEGERLELAGQLQFQFAALRGATALTAEKPCLAGRAMVQRRGGQRAHEQKVVQKAAFSSLCGGAECCIFHRQRAFGDFSDSDDDDLPEDCNGAEPEASALPTMHSSTLLPPADILQGQCIRLVSMSTLLPQPFELLHGNHWSDTAGLYSQETAQHQE